MMDAADKADIIEALKLVVHENAKLFGGMLRVIEKLELRVASLESGLPVDEIELRRAEQARDASPE